MSILETPRLYFRGEISWDPITTNNYPSRYDESVAEPMFDPGETVEQFRQSAIDAVVSDGNWNPHGTYRSSFFNTVVSGGDAGHGLDVQDAAVGVPVGFTGMLVDAEPYGTFSSQLFFDAISFGIDGGCRILAPRSRRMIARYINFNRNQGRGFIAGVASVNWQTSFNKEGLIIDARDSAVLGALQQALESPDVAGLTVQFNTYRTIYYDDQWLSNNPADTKAQAAAAAHAKRLTEQLQSGGFQPNPARSTLVGTVGLWRQDEPAQEPGGRALLTNPATLVPAWPGASVASAHARFEGDVLTVDLSNSISEADPAGEPQPAPPPHAKQDLGTLRWVARKLDGTVVPLADMDYSQYGAGAYEATSGIVTLTVADPIAATNDLIELHSADGKTIYLAESRLRAIPDEHNFYTTPVFNAANRQVPVQLGVQVYNYGLPAGANVPVAMVGAPSTAIYSTAVTDANGRCSFTYMPPATGGVEGFIFVPGPDAAIPATLNPLLNTYMFVRTLPPDADIAAQEPTWDNAYRYVLAKWKAMAPCMDNWLDLADEAQVRRYAPVIAKLTDPANFEMFRYMPVSRDLTDGERTLLYKFLGLAAPAAGDTLMAAEAVETETSVPKPTIEQLSRQMRNH